MEAEDRDYEQREREISEIFVKMLLVYKLITNELFIYTIAEREN